MKVNRRSDNRGATLVLNEAELVYLWHRLNCADHYTFDKYLETENFKPKIDSYRLFCELDKKYTPRDQ